MARPAHLPRDGQPPCRAVRLDATSDARVVRSVNFPQMDADRTASSRAAGLRRQLAATVQVLRAVLRSPALRKVLAAFLLFNAAVFGTWVAILVYAYGATGPASVGVVALVQPRLAAGSTSRTRPIDPGPAP